MHSQIVQVIDELEKQQANRGPLLDLVMQDRNQREPDTGRPLDIVEYMKHHKNELQVFGIPLLFGFVGIVAGMWLAAFLIAVSFWILLGSSYYFLSRLRKDVEARLFQSGLAERIAAKDPELLAVYESVPQPWRMIYLRFNPNTVRGMILMVARNLDWHLFPSQRHFRWTWPFPLVTAASLCTFIWYDFAVLFPAYTPGSGQLSPVSLTTPVIITLFVVQTVIALINPVRGLLLSACFVNYMKQLYSSPGDSSSAG
jgi:hypothetical protein